MRTRHALRHAELVSASIAQARGLGPWTLNQVQGDAFIRGSIHNLHATVADKRKPKLPSRLREGGRD